MIRLERFSEVTKRYLCRFEEILDEMISGMTNVKQSESISHNFIVQMIPHHEAALQMSHNLLQYTTLVPLQDIASGIITEQTISIENMKNILTRCSALTNSSQDICLYQKCFQQVTQAMFCEMQNASSTNNINVNFMREMIPAHRGRSACLKNALRYPVCPELIPILQSIIRSQEKGICEMERLLRCI